MSSYKDNNRYTEALAYKVLGGVAEYENGCGSVLATSQLTEATCKRVLLDIHTKDAWDRDFVIITDRSGRTVLSAGKDGVFGTRDDISAPPSNFSSSNADRVDHAFYINSTIFLFSVLVCVLVAMFFYSKSGGRK